MTDDRRQKTDEAPFNQKFLRMLHGQGRFFQKGVGDPNLFTVSQMQFFRGLHLKSLPKKQSFTRY